MSSREPSGEPAPAPGTGDERAAPPARAAPPTRASVGAGSGAVARGVAALLALALSLGAIAGVAYQRYAAVHLRALPKVPICVRGARVALRKPAAVSGTEPRQTASGETVYLTLGEDRAVACALQLDEALARHLAGALAEQAPAQRAARLLELVRDRVPADPAHDRAASAAYMMAAAALRGLPDDVAEVRAAADEIERHQACRFDTRRPCPTRPPLPVLVWLAGVPAALSVLGLLWIGLTASAARYRRWTAQRHR
ncbi:hypothetical protein WME90_02800 [Sorangium sp. So ce375]|uniref:hypothetical protein n=1 Tax=Sorangium sp. So ce375 TaxID=3133306 RepID=UPI003F5C01AD